MKKACVLLLMQLLMFGTVSYGATSDDVYVRKDVFDAKMEAMFNRLDGRIQVLSERMDGNFAKLSERIDGLGNRIDGINASLSEKIDVINTSLSARIDDLRNGIYLWLVAIGLVVTVIATVIAWPKLQEKLRALGKSAPSITLEDVKRLIEENNARIARKAQA